MTPTRRGTLTDGIAETLEPLPGRRIGDIGPKAYAAHAATDHGCESGQRAVEPLTLMQIPVIRFDHVRIPRDHMLSRFTSVTREGKYQAGPHAKLSYGGVSVERALDEYIVFVTDRLSDVVHPCTVSFQLVSAFQLSHIGVPPPGSLNLNAAFTLSKGLWQPQYIRLTLTLIVLFQQQLLRSATAPSAAKVKLVRTV